MSFLSDILRVFSQSRKRRAVPTRMNTWSLELLPVQAREESFFSVAVENARLLSEMQRRIDQEIMSVEHGAGTMSAHRFISEMKKILAAEGETGDIATTGRLKLIHDTQVARTYEKARYYRDMRSDTLRNAFPAQELVRIGERELKRDWPSRWVAAGGDFTQGNRMIARVDSPIWTAISRFGTPWPPFAFNSGMGLEAISRSEAEALGIIEPGEEIPLPPDPVDDFPKAGISDLEPEALDFLRHTFGDRLQLQNGTATLLPTAANARSGYHEWKEEDHPRDADGKFSTTGQIAMGNKSLAMALRRKGDIRRAMMHNTLGRIDFVWGREGSPKPDKNGKTFADGYGISHIARKHPYIVNDLPEILARGEIKPHRYANPDKIEIHFGQKVALLQMVSPKQEVPWNDPENQRILKLMKRKRNLHYYALTAIIDD